MIKHTCPDILESFPEEDRVEAFVLQVKMYPLYKELGDEGLSEVIFATKPSS